MTQAIQRMLRERKVLSDATLTERVWSERMRVKAAFFEGVEAGARMAGVLDPHEMWQLSASRADLYPGPPTPVHLAAKLRSHGHKLCDCRRPGGPGEGR